MATKPINRIKIVLVENGKTNKWLAKQLKKNPNTVSRWCTNDMQPALKMLVEIARVLNADVRELLHPTKEK